MSWKNILKNDERENLIMQAEDKTEPIMNALMAGIDTYEEQSFSPKEIADGKELEEMEKEYAYAHVYDTAFGRVSFTITMDGRVLDGYFDGGEIDLAEAKKQNKKMKKDEHNSLMDEDRVVETPDDYYYN